MQLVPFDPAWVTGKADLHAIYRRPDGDVTTGLPVRRHLDWLRKGFSYVTLADGDSLMAVAGSLRAQGYDVRGFIADPRTNSPWSYDAYVRAGFARPQTPAPVQAPPAAPRPLPRKRGRPGKRRPAPPVAPVLGDPTA